MRRLAPALVAGLAVAAPAWALDRSDFRYERPLSASGSSPIVFEPDGAMYAHTLARFADLRIEDASGNQVPWRRLPEPRTPRPAPVQVLNSGRQGDTAVALLDFGLPRQVRERIELTIPDSGFVGRVEVLGSEDRAVFTRLSTSVVYDVEGVEGRARSTVVAFPPSDYRYLQLRARGISRIDGATVLQVTRRSVLRPVEATVTRTSRNPTRLVLDLGHANVPVDELEVSSRTRRYDRAVTVEGSNDKQLWQPLASARVFRLRGSAPTPIRIDGRHRYLRLTVRNGDDAPLEGIEVEALARPRRLLVEGGHPLPLLVLYGDRSARAPSYDFARLPAPRAREPGILGPERRNELFEPPEDTRSFVARHSSLVTAALALAALAVGVGGVLALRRRA